MRCQFAREAAAHVVRRGRGVALGKVLGIVCRYRQGTGGRHRLPRAAKILLQLRLGRAVAERRQFGVGVGQFLQVFRFFGAQPQFGRVRVGEIPLGQPYRYRLVKGGAEQVGVGLDDVVFDFVLYFRLVLPADRLRGHHLSQDYQRNRLVHVFAQFGVVGGACLALEQLNGGAERGDGGGGVLDGGERSEQLLFVGVGGG